MLGDCEKVDPAAGMRYIPHNLYPCFSWTLGGSLPTHPTLLGTQ